MVSFARWLCEQIPYNCLGKVGLVSDVGVPTDAQHAQEDRRKHNFNSEEQRERTEENNPHSIEMPKPVGDPTPYDDSIPENANTSQSRPQ